MEIKILSVTPSRDFYLEVVDATPVKGRKDVAIHHTNGRWIITDIATGMLVGSGHTKKEVLEWFNNHKLDYENYKGTERYQKKLAQFKELENL